jgi:hypothetical protein
VVARLGPARRPRDHVEDGFRARRDAEPAWTQSEPPDLSSSGPHLRPAAQRPREARPRDVDEQGPAPGVAHGDGRGGDAPEREPQGARAERDAAAAARTTATSARLTGRSP